MLIKKMFFFKKAQVISSAKKFQFFFQIHQNFIK